MKSAKTVIKLFKDCHIDSYDVADGVIHIFNISNKKGAKIRYLLREQPANVMWVWSRTIKEQAQTDEVRKALISMIDAKTNVSPRAALRLAGN